MWVSIVKETAKLFSADCNCTAGYVNEVYFLLTTFFYCNLISMLYMAIWIHPTTSTVLLDCIQTYYNPVGYI